MGILDASLANGGSVNAAKSSSFTNGTAATQASAASAQMANELAMKNWREQAEFNAEQARIQRDWQEKMSNTVYQRSVADMKAAGINPILAAANGISSAGVPSGAAAAASAPSTFMGNAYPDTNSASESNGNSWNHSESGLATFLTSMGTLISGILGKMNSSNTVNIALKMLDREQATYEGLTSNDQKVQQKTTNQIKNGSDNPFVKGTTAYDMYELQKATDSFKYNPKG